MLGLHCCWAFSSCGEHQLLSNWSAQASHCGGFCGRGAGALGHTGLNRCSAWTQQLQLPVSRAPAQWLWLIVALWHYGIFLDQGLNWSLLHWQANSLSLSQQGSPQVYQFKMIYDPWCRTLLLHGIPFFWTGPYHLQGAYLHHTC